MVIKYDKLHLHFCDNHNLPPGRVNPFKFNDQKSRSRNKFHVMYK